MLSLSIAQQLDDVACPLRQQCAALHKQPLCLCIAAIALRGTPQLGKHQIEVQAEGTNGAHPWLRGLCGPVPICNGALACSTSPSQALALCTAAKGSCPFASSAAMADAKVQPVEQRQRSCRMPESNHRLVCCVVVWWWLGMTLSDV